MSVAEAARRHGVTATTISDWRERFIEAGKGGLENKNSGPAHSGTVAERRLRSENAQLKLRSPSRWSSYGCGRRGPSTSRMSLL
jgi:transposase